MYFLYLSRGCAEQQLLFLLFACFILVTWSLDETDISCLLWFIRRWNSNFLFWMSTAFPPFLTADNLHQLIVPTVLLNVRSVIMEETQRKQWQFRVGPVSCVSWSIAALKWDTAELLLPRPQCYHTWLCGFSDREDVILVRREVVQSC